ncbi:hypothetical protein [Desulfobacula sp.]|uniref:hypothetical protein n=1 Tax=Desulfobacula sp. TaxID=2593537 RepID=UPI00261CE124|nr:hypothetical protein [Desulfobacula sp.]
MSLAQQLDSGIRAFDIRLRHLNNSFTVHHGAAYQNATFGNNASRVFEIAPGIVVAMDALTI